MKNVALFGLILITAIMGIVVVYDIFKNDRIAQVTDQSNWMWEDSWGQNSPRPKPPTPIAPQRPEGQLTAATFQDALRISGETGRPIFVFLEADWCVWCKKMKSETLQDSEVRNMLKNYILVYVDVDINPNVGRQFNTRGVPSYVITNYKNDRLKAGSGYVKPSEFSKWLNNPNLYVQPKR